MMILLPLEIEYRHESYLIFIFAWLFISIIPPKSLKTLLYVFSKKKEDPGVLPLHPIFQCRSDSI